jgi:acetyltransferase-like isoleucine patch superfamily enzyme
MPLDRVRRLLTRRREPDPRAFAAFGSGSVIVPPAYVTCPQHIEIGRDVVILARAWLSVVDEHNGRRYSPRLRIGDRTHLGQDLVVACIGQVDIGEDVLVSDRVFLGDTYHDYRDPDTPVIRQPMAEPKPVRVERGAFIGVGAIVLPGVTIGENGYVAAGAVVTRDVAPRAVVAGNPARVIRQV